MQHVSWPFLGSRILSSCDVRLFSPRFVRDGFFLWPSQLKKEGKALPLHSVSISCHIALSSPPGSGSIPYQHCGPWISFKSSLTSVYHSPSFTCSSPTTKYPLAPSFRPYHPSWTRPNDRMVLPHMNSNSRITTRNTRHMQTEARTPSPHSTLICAHLPLKQGTESNCRQQVGTKLWEHVSSQRHNPSQPGRARDDLNMCSRIPFISKFTEARWTGKSS